MDLLISEINGARMSHVQGLQMSMYIDVTRGFYEKFKYSMSINREGMVKTQGDHASLIEILLFILFISW